VSPVPHVLAAGPLDATSITAGLGAVVPLSEATTHHLRRVLRLELGDELSVTDGEGRTALAQLTGRGAALTSTVTVAVAATPELVLVQALAKGRRLDEAVRAACELGVDRIVPVITQRTQGRPGADERAATVERWRALARSALEQSRSAHLTKVDEVCTCEDLAVVPGPPAAAPLPSGGRVPEVPVRRRLLAVPGAAALPDVLAARSGAPPAAVTIAVGPEGGWTDDEVARLMAAGWESVGLGRTVLRTEHAGTVALAAIAAISGRWRDDG
jgi:16S rRNA (uracil1498-N3)-methyltransferase